MPSFSKKLTSLVFIAFFLTSSSVLSKTIIDAGFEKGIPRDARLYRADVEHDTTRAHTGTASVRLSKKPKTDWGTIGFDLDGRMDFSQSCEISVWVYTEKKTRVVLYISASEGGKDRYDVVSISRHIEPGEWRQIKAEIPAGDMRKNHWEFRSLIRTHGTCWVDDFKVVSGEQPDSPSKIWPRLKETYQSRANRRVSDIAAGASLSLDARNAVLVPDTGRMEVTQPSGGSVAIPAEGMLVFAVNAKEDVNLTGSLQLDPDADLRPGLRVTVLADDTVIAAPSVKAKAWKDVRTDPTRPGSAPDIQGERPSSTVTLAPFRLSKGRHYIAVYGPHIRSGGTFAKLDLQAASQPAEKPLYTFGFLTDTHLGFGRPVWMNTKLNIRAGAELETALRQLKREGADFVILGGDMTDGGRLGQYEELAGIIKRANLPVYGCLGNHDTFRNARGDIEKTIPKLFPNGPKNTDYDFSKPPLRFIVLDGSYWKGKDVPTQGFRGGKADQTTMRDGAIDWLRDTLAKDTNTPTIVISHYQFYLRRGVSDMSGYNLGNGEWMNKSLMVPINAATNVVATMNGHLHYNSIGNYNGITSIQNPAFVEWPNAYRVCRVYPDRMEWEVRQMANRGLVREGVVKEKALLWMLSTYEGDLSGTVGFAPRTPVTTVLNEGFEGSAPPKSASYYRVTRETDTTRAHSGRSSLRVNTTGRDWGTIGFNIDQKMDFNAAGECSVWIYADSAARVSAYISAQADGTKNRHTVAQLKGKIEPGKWCQFKATVPAGYWRMDEQDVRLVIRTHGECWIDDVTMNAVRTSK